MTKKAAFTLADRIRSIGKDTKFKSSFDDLAKEIEKDAKKGGKNTGEIIGKFMIDHPALLNALQAAGLVSPGLLAEIDRQRQEIAAEYADEAKWDAAFADERTPQEILDDAWWDKMLPEGETPEEKATKNAKVMGTAIAKGFQEGVVSVLGTAGGVLEGIFDFSFENIFGVTPDEAGKQISDDIWWAISFMPTPAVDWAKAIWPNGDIFGGLDLTAIVGNGIAALFDAKTWGNAIDSAGSFIKDIGTQISSTVIGVWGTIQPVVNTVLTSINNFLSSVFDVKQWASAIGGFGNELVKIATNIIKAVVDAVVQGVSESAGLLKKGANAITGGIFQEAEASTGGDTTTDFKFDANTRRQWTDKNGTVWEQRGPFGRPRRIGQKVNGRIIPASGFMPTAFVQDIRPQGDIVSSVSNKTPEFDTLNRQLTQIQRILNVVGRAIRGVSSDLGNLASSTKEDIAANNFLNRTITQVTRVTNVEGRAVRGLSSDTLNLADSIKEWIATNNVVNKTIQQVTKVTNLSGRAVRGLSSDVGQLGESFNNSADDAKNFARALIAVAVAAKKARAATSGGGGGSSQIAQHGMHTNLEQDTLILAHKGERVDIGPGNQSNGGGGIIMAGGGDIVVNLTNVLSDREIIRTYRRKMGENMYRFGPS